MRLLCHLSVFIFVQFLLSACSDVSFAPADDEYKFNGDLSGQQLSEKFTQGIQGKKLDILFVVDNSISMAEEQSKMGERIGSFISTLHDVDWQIGITTTDVGGGLYGLKGDLLKLEGINSNVLTSKVVNYEDVFKNTVIREETVLCTGSCPSGDEQPLRAAIMAMEKHRSYNAGFFRSDADLGLVILSDEDEMSIGPAHATKPEEVINTVQRLWGDTKRLHTYGMIVVPGDISCLDAQRGQGAYGAHVADLSMLTGGLVGSVCDDDYAPTLGVIGDRARRLLEYVQLKAYPRVDTVSVRFIPAHVSNFYINGRRVYFETPPPKDTEILIDYTVR